jgi:hypothetical protein
MSAPSDPLAGRLEPTYAGAHLELVAFDEPDAAPAPRERRLPRHRARRARWHPPSEPVQALHAHHGESLLG